MGNQVAVRLLASGGIDSTALIDFYLRRRAKVVCVHFQYGQLNARSEREALRRVCEHYGVESTVIDLGFTIARRKDEFVTRNALFVLTASCLELAPARIALGIHSGSEYYDCARRFLSDCQRLLDGYFAGTVTVEAPFLDFTKQDIFAYCRKYDVPTNLTYSCQRQDYPPCGRCASCHDRERFSKC